MVSLWPWKDDTSAAAFEKTLSNLAKKIASTQSKNGALQQRSRRWKVMWTLYTGFAYILAALILTLVTGRRNWGPIEYTVLSGGPLLIYAVRAVLTAYYNYRISSTQGYLESLHKERDTTIDRLKAATKYNSTQELLDKYSGEKASPTKQDSESSSPSRRKSGRQSVGPQQGRTNIAPPPTANIPRNRNPISPAPTTPQQPTTGQVRPQSLKEPSHPLRDIPHESEPVLQPEFAPNAFSPTLTYLPSSSTLEPKWYDRILDVLLGEDETQPKNRFVLICAHCRLVNGQAPPGTKTLEDVGQWRCRECHQWNGQESETQRLVQQVAQKERVQSQREVPGAKTFEEDVKAQPRKSRQPRVTASGDGAEGDSEDGVELDSPSSSVDMVDDVDIEDEPEPETAPPAKSTRNKPKGKKK